MTRAKLPGIDDPPCVCGHTAATAHDITTTPQGQQFGPCTKTGCCCAAYTERRPYPGNCPSCAVYWATGQAIAADWYAAPPADQSALSTQIAQALVMYLEHAMAHTGINLTEETP